MARYHVQAPTGNPPSIYLSRAESLVGLEESNARNSGRLVSWD